MPSLLLVSAAFAPSRAIGGRRAERMARHLAARGWRVTVLTLQPELMLPVDPGLSAAGDFELIRTSAAMPRAWARALRQRAAAAAVPGRARDRVTGATGASVAGRAGACPPPRDFGAARAAVAGWLPAVARAGQKLWLSLEFPDEWVGWLPFAAAAVRGRRFDVVLGTTPPVTDLLVAAALARQTGAQLVLDYRDPWSELANHTGGGFSGLAPLHRAVEDACLREAALVLAVTPTLTRWLQARCACPVELVTNGTEAPPVPPLPFEADTGPRRLVYAGSLAYGRDLEPLLQAMARLRPDAGPAQLRLDYAGPHGDGLLAQADRHGVADAVTLHGELPSAQALALLDGALAGVVLVSPGFDYAYPGKIFEILGRRRPLLAVAPAGCDTARLVAEHGLGWTHAADDVAGLATSLRSALRGETPVPARLEQLGAAHVMGRLDARLRELLASTAA